MIVKLCGNDVLIDKRDYGLIKKHNWWLLNGYLITSIKDKTVYLHRLLLKTNKKFVVDHQNRNKLDNRRSNLRIITFQQNLLNSKLRKENKSGYRGVSYDKTRPNNVWVVHLSNNHLGRYKDKWEAAWIYNQAAAQMFGRFAQLNKI